MKDSQRTQVPQFLRYRCQARTPNQTKGPQRTQVPQSLQYRCQARRPTQIKGCQRTQVLLYGILYARYQCVGCCYRRRRSLALAAAPWRSRLQPSARSIVLRKAAVRSDGRVTACEQVTSNYKTGHCRLHFGGCPMKICPDLRAANSKGPHATHQRTRFGSQWFVNGLNEDLCGCYFWHISRWIKRRDRCPSG